MRPGGGRKRRERKEVREEGRKEEEEVRARRGGKKKGVDVAEPEVETKRRRETRYSRGMSDSYTLPNSLTRTPRT